MRGLVPGSTFDKGIGDRNRAHANCLCGLKCEHDVYSDSSAGPTRNNERNAESCSGNALEFLGIQHRERRHVHFPVRLRTFPWESRLNRGCGRATRPRKVAGRDSHSFLVNCSGKKPFVGGSA